MHILALFVGLIMLIIGVVVLAFLLDFAISCRSQLDLKELAVLSGVALSATAWTGTGVYLLIRFG